MTQGVDAEELKMILWSKNPYLRIAQMNELGPIVNIAEDAVFLAEGKQIKHRSELNTELKS